MNGLVHSATRLQTVHSSHCGDAVYIRSLAPVRAGQSADKHADTTCICLCFSAHTAEPYDSHVRQLGRHARRFGVVPLCATTTHFNMA
jgi:hypothetical protein